MSSQPLPFAAMMASSSSFSAATDLMGSMNLTGSPLHLGDDPNSPEMFRQNAQIIQHHITRLQDLAQRALLGISNAYQPGRNPIHAEADLSTLKQELHLVLEMMRVSGVGALPLLSTPPADAATPAAPGAPPSATTSSAAAEANSRAAALLQDDRLLEDTRRRVNTVYEQQRRMHAVAETVANLLAHAPPPGPGHAPGPQHQAQSGAVGNAIQRRP
ncbi:hypothetical protein HGRIS_005507 [Hohenbuehelia grisea]|uniref:Uncharacterized protein n=1 Tax=Hohenbuehelia grisea TaxID=104357 RepID=A0ABR3JY39_9AGAR